MECAGESVLGRVCWAGESVLGWRECAGLERVCVD